MRTRLRQLFAGKASNKTWASSQDYELEHAIGFMKEPFFRQLHAEWKAGKLNASTGHRDALMLSEFFGKSREEADKFFNHIAGKTCLDIGPCVFSPLSTWDVAGTRFAVEPLLQPIEEWQETNLGASAYKDMHGYAKPAEQLIPELLGRVDGAILCRNMLDHTPKWPFVLANISAYAAPGCRLLLWTDLDHHGEADEGHYEITSDTASFKRLVEQLGFSVVREHSSPDRPETNWGCFAIRR
jgi:hypothetical protein